MNDGLDVFRSMLSGASNRRENLRPNIDSANTPSPGMGGGGGQDAPPFGGGGGGGGMDAWQTSVEKRLDSLDRRAATIEADVGKIKTDVATLIANVSHLPSKGFVVTATLTGLTVLSLLTALITNMDKLLN